MPITIEPADLAWIESISELRPPPTALELAMRLAALRLRAPAELLDLGPDSELGDLAERCMAVFPAAARA